ncbi:HGGxSTG domain-containing protein [Rhodanobacter hydrolyticus]|uniref:Uncharacterized protein n=1 Tax=Rhodanobacter hydrolyticus TaxID=2250595 RepID=A0ABW8J6W5_9GAMM
MSEREVTRRGIGPDYVGDDTSLCNARTKSGHPCRATALRGGRCKWHGGLSTGPTTDEGKRCVAMNLPRVRAKHGGISPGTTSRTSDDELQARAYRYLKAISHESTTKP